MTDRTTLRHVHIGQTLSIRSSGGLVDVAALHCAMLEVGIQSRLIFNESHDSITEPPAILKLQAIWNNRFYFGWKSAARIRCAIEEADVVHVHGLYTYMNYLAGKYCRKQNKALIYHPHGCLVPAYLKMGRIKKGIALRAFERRNFRGLTAVRALTEVESEQIHDFIPGAKTIVIPNGVSLPKHLSREIGRNIQLDLDANPNKRVFLFLSRVRFAKGLDLLLDAWVAANISGCELWIAGPDVDGTGQLLRKKIYDRKLGSVVMIGAVSEENKNWLFRATDVFVLTSRGEGQSPAILEAMAHAKPVLLTTTCYFPEVEAAGAGWECELSVAHITALLIRFSQLHSSALETMGQKGRLLVSEKYCITSIAQDLDRRVREVAHIQ